MTIDGYKNIVFTYNKQNVENVNRYKYLGHVLSNKKDIHGDMCPYIITQAQKALFSLKCDTKENLGYIPATLAIQMFDTYILPILENNNAMVKLKTKHGTRKKSKLAT